MTANVYNLAHHSNVKPWWGTGVLFSHDDTTDDWARKAGLDWEILTSPVFYSDQDGKPHVTKKRRVLYRSDTKAAVSVMSDRYIPVQPREMLDFYRKLQDETGCPLHCAGSLGDGNKFLGTAKIDLDASDAGWRVAGEYHARYWLVSTANDGSMATRLGPTDVQVVCENTLSMALSESGIVAINHRSKIDWGEVRADLDRVRGTFGVFDGLLELLATVPIDKTYAAEFVHDVAAPKWKPENSDSKPPRPMVKLAQSIHSSPGQAERGATAYALLSGATHYVDHGRQARSASTRFDAAQFGAGALLKRAALDKLLADCVNRWGRSSDVFELVKSDADLVKRVERLAA